MTTHVRIVAVSVSILLVGLLAACSSQVPALHETPCYVPTIECKPGQYSAVGLDTVNVQSDGYRYHIDLLPSPVNSDFNDNAIVFLDRSHAAISAERTSRGAGRQPKRDADSIYEHQRLLLSTFGGDEQFSPLREVQGTDSFETVGACWNSVADGLLYFTAKAPNDDADDYDLYTARISFAGDIATLGDIRRLSSVDQPNAFDGQPTVSPDGLTLVFTSDRLGGYGGTDLWMSRRASVSAVWPEPTALPGPVNSECDEITPSYSRDGKNLFFASDGHATVGGYDLFSSTTDWKNVRNLGTPVNTQADEVFPYELSDSQFFYSSSQKTDFKGMNLFEVRRTKIDRLVSSADPRQLPDSIELHGHVLLPKLDRSGSPEVFVRDVARDTEIARKPTDTTGAYAFTVQNGRQYDVGADVQDKFYDVHRVDLRHESEPVVEVPPLSVPDTLVLRINFPFDDDAHPYDFVYDDGGKRSDTKWQTSLDLLAHSIKSSSSSLKRVLLYGHTDSLGTDEYNRALAMRRAAFIARELEKRGIAAKLLVIASKGRTSPVARRDGEDDETYRLRCRRVEFVKVFGKETTR